MYYRWGNRKNRTKTEKAPDGDFVDMIKKKWKNQRFQKIVPLFLWKR